MKGNHHVDLFRVGALHGPHASNCAAVLNCEVALSLTILQKVEMLECNWLNGLHIAPHKVMCAFNLASPNGLHLVALSALVPTSLLAKTIFRHLALCRPLSPAPTSLVFWIFSLRAQSVRYMTTATGAPSSVSLPVPSRLITRSAFS